MLFNKNIVLSLGAVILATACTTSNEQASPTDEDPSGENELRGVKPCGGVAGLQCEADRICVGQERKNNLPDSTGICRRATGKRGEGELCGGTEELRCLSAFACAVTSRMLHAYGTCEKTATRPQLVAGETCGGKADLRCAADLDCVIPEDSKQEPFASGSCTQKVADGQGQGEICGGIAGLQCAPELYCLLSGQHPDASGTCVKLE